MIYLDEIYIIFKRLSIHFSNFNLLFALYFYLTSDVVTYEINPHDLHVVLRKSNISMKPELIQQAREILKKQLLLNQKGSYSYKSKHRITLQGDTTTDGRKYSNKKAKKIYKLWDNNLAKVIKTHGIIMLSFQIGTGEKAQRYVLDFRIYDKRHAKTQAQYLTDMIKELKAYLELVDCDTSLLVLTFDSSFSWLDDLEVIDGLGINFVGKFHHNQKVYLNDKQLIITKWLRQRFYIKDFNVINDYYNKHTSNWTHYKCFTLGDYEDYKVILFLGKQGKRNKRSRLLLVTNMKTSSYITILERWLCRWSIETIFKEESVSLGWNDYQRHTDSTPLDNHIALCCIKYNILMGYREKHRLKKYGIKRILRKITIELSEYRLSEIVDIISNKINEELSCQKQT